MGAFTHSLLSSEQTGITHSLTSTSQASMGVAMFRLARYRLRAPAGAPGRQVEAEAAQGWPLLQLLRNRRQSR